MSEPRYPAARALASRLEQHFLSLAEGDPAAVGLAPPPDALAIEALIDAGFWASLLREEGRFPEISLAFLPPELAGQPLKLAAHLPLGPRALARLAPAVERPGIHLGVWRERGELFVWGTTRSVPRACFVLEVIGPGLLVVKHRLRQDSAKFRNVAVFEGEQVKILSSEAVKQAGCRTALLTALLAPEPEGAADSAQVLLRLAVSMRAHRRGGTLLVVPAGSEAWRESIVRPISYAVEPAFTELAELLDPLRPDTAGPAVSGTVERALEALAGLTAVDGAMVMTDRYDLLAFGAKIARPDGRPRVEQVAVREAIEAGSVVRTAPVQLGGTRHISAAQFAQDQQDALALVASQDGRFTVFAWGARESIVNAFRVETLLL